MKTKLEMECKVCSEPFECGTNSIAYETRMCIRCYQHKKVTDLLYTILGKLIKVPKLGFGNTKMKDRSGIIHLSIGGQYACLPCVNANPLKLTKNKDKVTCENCQKIMYHDD